MHLINSMRGAWHAPAHLGRAICGREEKDDHAAADGYLAPWDY